MGLILPCDDVVGVAERVRFGDATMGWRGDATLDVYINDESGAVEVMGFDGLGQRYVAATVDTARDPGWRYTLIRKLIDGDWQRADTTDRFMAEFAAQHQAEADRVEDYQNEHADKLAWAIKKDLGHLYG